MTFLYSYLKFSLVLLGGMVLLFLDFYTKSYLYNCSARLACALPIEIFSNFLGVDFSIVLIVNRGMAWGLLQNFQYPLLVIRIAIVIFLFFYLGFVNKNRALVIPFVFILAGAIGNIVDFFVYGFVIDFLHFTFWGYSFPVFNLADVWITLGVIALFLLSWTKKEHKYNAKDT